MTAGLRVGERELARALGAGLHLGELSAVTAATYRDRPAIEDVSATPGLHPGGVRTFAQVEHAVARLAAVLEAHAVAPGDRVLVAIDNRVDVLLLAMAVARLGAVAALVSPRLRVGELQHVRAATHADHVVVDDPALGVRIADGLDAVQVMETGAAVDGPGLTAWLDANPDEVITASPGCDPDAVTLLLATSGTTGAPKAAALTSRGLLGIGSIAARLPVGRPVGRRAGRDLALSALPLSHVMGFANFVALLCAGMPQMHCPRFDAARVLDLIEQRRPNFFSGVPTMYADLEAAGADDRDLSSVQLWGSGADAMPPERARRFRRRGSWLHLGRRQVGDAVFVDSYGMVELSGAAAVRLYPPGPSGLRVPAIAAVLPGFEARTVDETGRRLRSGRLGELQFRGPSVMQEYLDHPHDGPDAEGWLATGDHARLWRGRFFSFSGRGGDRLKVGGFSVFPAEVEAELGAHPDVAEITLVGVDDERLGQRPVAVCVPAAPSFDADAFLAWARQRVAGYRTPTEVVVIDAVPRSGNGKVDRRAATRIAEGAGRRR